jgi:hypothetical protein
MSWLHSQKRHQLSPSQTALVESQGVCVVAITDVNSTATLICMYSNIRHCAEDIQTYNYLLVCICFCMMTLLLLGVVTL